MKVYKSRKAMEVEVEMLPRTVFIEVDTSLLASLIGRTVIDPLDGSRLSLVSVRLGFDVNKEQTEAVLEVRREPSSES